MNDFRPDHRPYQAPPRRFLSLVLTIAVHVGLLAFLLIGINWQSKQTGSLEVGLVSGPSGPAPAPAPPPEPPKPEPPAPEPPKPEPPKEEPPPPQPKPEIATKKPEPKKPEKPKPEPPKQEKKPEPKPKPKPPEPDLKPIDFQKLTNQKLNKEAERIADAKKATDLLGGGQQGQSRQTGGGSPGELDAYRTAIAGKVRRNLVAPPGLSGNPSAVFEIEQVMGGRGGEVINVKLKQSSGNKALDEAIERAIRKSDPLPPPDNPALFRRKLEVTFRPLEE